MNVRRPESVRSAARPFRTPSRVPARPHPVSGPCRGRDKERRECRGSGCTPGQASTRPPSLTAHTSRQRRENGAQKPGQPRSQLFDKIQSCRLGGPRWRTIRTGIRTSLAKLQRKLDRRVVIGRGADQLLWVAYRLQERLVRGSRGPLINAIRAELGIEAGADAFNDLVHPTPLGRMRLLDLTRNRAGAVACESEELRREFPRPPPGHDRAQCALELVAGHIGRRVPPPQRDPPRESRARCTLTPPNRP